VEATALALSDQPVLDVLAGVRFVKVELTRGELGFAGHVRRLVAVLQRAVEVPEHLMRVGGLAGERCESGRATHRPRASNVRRAGHRAGDYLDLGRVESRERRVDLHS